MGDRLVQAAPAREEASDSVTGKLEAVRALVDDDLALVNEIILDRMRSEVPLIPELARHLIAAGGKRVRPMLTLLSARLCGHRGKRQLGLAACVEFIHTATLLHDDVVDDSGLAAARPPPTPSGATRPRCWSATSSSAAPSSSWSRTAPCGCSTSWPTRRR